MRHGLSQHIDHTTALIWDREVQNKWSGCEGLPPDCVQMFLSKLADFEIGSADDFWKSTSDIVSAPLCLHLPMEEGQTWTLSLPQATCSRPQQEEKEQLRTEFLNPELAYRR